MFDNRYTKIYVFKLVLKFGVLKVKVKGFIKQKPLKLKNFKALLFHSKVVKIE